MDRTLSPTRQRLVDLINETEELKGEIEHSSVQGHSLSVLREQAHRLHHDLFERIQISNGFSAQKYIDQFNEIRQDLNALEALRHSDASEHFDRNLTTPRIRRGR